MDINEINLLPITDQEQIAMLVEAGDDGAADLIEELLDLFKEEAAPQLQAINNAIASRSFSDASRPAHALAGSSANLGGLRLSKLAKAMELAANAGDGEKLITLVPTVASLFASTVSAFEKEIAVLRNA